MISEALKEYELYEVGGYVRDEIIGRPSNDCDLATNATPDVVEKALAPLGTIYTVGQKFGTVALIIDSKLFEVTTYRKEAYTDGSRHPVVEYSNSLLEDLSRRDFTMNAIARNLRTGEIVDPYDGTTDIKNRIIRCVGNDDDRFKEDPLRMLRAIRFACQLGFRLKLRINHPEWISEVSNERIRDEFNKILLSPRPSGGVLLLNKTGLTKHFLPEFDALKDVMQGKNHVKDAYAHSLLVLKKGSDMEKQEHDKLVFRLACLTHDFGKPETKSEEGNEVHFYSHHSVGATIVRRVMKRLRYDKRTTDRVTKLVKMHMEPIMLQREFETDKLNRRLILRIIRRCGEEDIINLLDLVKCDISSSKNPRYKFVSVLYKMVSKALEEKPSEITSPLDGNEIMEFLNLKQGTQIGRIKAYLTTCVIDGVLERDDKEGAKELLKKYIL
jgi:putative nucleotidyltransferase with HDIG domain